MIEYFLQTLINALAVGSLYALIALGYTMVYGILKFINFAHSDVFVLGAWISLASAMAFGWGPESGNPFPHVALWVWIVLGSLGGLAVFFGAYERLLRPRMAGGLVDRLPATNLAGTLALMSAWAALAVALLFIAGLLEGVGPLRVVGGGLILIASMLACGLVGFTIERVAYKPLRRASRLNVLITAIGISLLLQNAGQLNWMFGTRPQPMPTLLQDSILASIGGTIDPASDPSNPTYLVQPVRIRLLDVIGAGTAVVLMLLLDRLVFKTKLGRAMRAVSHNASNASLMGIPVDAVISFTFVLGAMLAAAAGFLSSLKYEQLGQPAAAVWVLLGLKAFVAAVIGGIGNIRGAMLGGLLIGVLEFFGAAYISPAMRDVYVFSLLILVLLFRPGGLLGSTAIEKV